MDERTVIEKRTEVTHGDPVAEGTQNVNIGPDGQVQVQEDTSIDDPVGATTVRKETTVEERRSP